MLNMLAMTKKTFAQPIQSEERMSQDWTFVVIFLREGRLEERGELHWRLLEI